MRIPTVMALPAFFLALCSTAASAEETAKPAGAQGVTTVPTTVIKGRRPPHTVDVAPVPIKVPLHELKNPLADRIGTAFEKSPF